MDQVQKLRDDLKGLNLSRLEALSGINRRQFQRIIYGETSPTYRTILLMQQAVAEHRKAVMRPKPAE